MQTDAYTADAICMSLGLPSFANDPLCRQADLAIRLLLTPSFHPEICLTFADGGVSVVSPREMIWHQPEPRRMLTDRADGAVAPEVMGELLELAEVLAKSGQGPGLMIDGMSSDILVFQKGETTFSSGRHACVRDEHEALVKLAISTAWQSISDPFCRNALSAAGKYVKEKIPLVEEPARKPKVGTWVMGSAEDRAELLEALRATLRD